MGEHGMVNMKSIVEVKFPVDRMSEILDVEKGWGPHYVALDEKTFKELVCQARRIPQMENELKRGHKECSLIRGEALSELGGEVNAKERPQNGIVINSVENSVNGVQRLKDKEFMSVTKLGFPQDNQMVTKGKSIMVGENLFNNNYSACRKKSQLEETSGCEIVED